MTLSTSAPIVWSELDHRFEKEPSGDIRIAYNVDAVRSSIANILGTRQGSRVMLPTFAETYTDFLFDPIDSHLSAYLSDRAKEVIETWDDRVIVISADFRSFPDENRITMTVYFTIRGYQNIMELTHEF